MYGTIIFDARRQVFSLVSHFRQHPENLLTCYHDGEIIQQKEAARQSTSRDFPLRYICCLYVCQAPTPQNLPQTSPTSHPRIHRPPSRSLDTSHSRIPSFFEIGLLQPLAAPSLCNGNSCAAQADPWCSCAGDAIENAWITCLYKNILKSRR